VNLPLHIERTADGIALVGDGAAIARFLFGPGRTAEERDRAEIRGALRRFRQWRALGCAFPNTADRCAAGARTERLRVTRLVARIRARRDAA
jgi:hypothetical protein